MKTKLLLLFCFILLIINPVFAKVKNQTTQGKSSILGTRGDTDYRVHNVGNVWCAVSNFATCADPNLRLPSMEWPAGSGAYYLWEGRLWVGAIVDGVKRVSHADYGNYEFYPSTDAGYPRFLFGSGCCPNFVPSSPKSIQDGYAIYDDLLPVSDHTPLGIRVFQRSLSWSSINYDDFIAFEFYIVNVGSSTLNDVMIAFCYDDDITAGPAGDPSDPHLDDCEDYDGYDGTDTDTDEEDVVDPFDLDDDGITGYDDWGLAPVRVAEYGNAYSGPGPEPDGLFDEYSIIEDKNGHPITYDVDFTNGKGFHKKGDVVIKANGDTLKGWKVSRGMSYCFDADNKSTPENDTGERSQPVHAGGYMGTKYLHTPDNATAQPFSHQWWNWESDPGNDTEKYDYMMGQHASSFGYRYLPNPLTPKIGADVFDYRYLISTGPLYNFAPGDTIKIVKVSAVGLGLKGLRENIDNAIKAYYSGSLHSNPENTSDQDSDVHWLLPAPPVIPQLRYSPEKGGVRLAWDNAPEITPDQMDKEYDFVGYKIYRSMYSTGNWELIYACDNLPNTKVYITNTEGDTMNKGNPVDLPNITHTFIDNGQPTPWGTKVSRPIDGLPYYYTVVAFDRGRPERNPPMPPQESARNNYMSDPSTGAPIPVYPGKVYEKTDTPPKLLNVQVVPNPYIGTNLLEARYENVIMFKNLPPTCKISIYTVSGDWVDTIYHTNGTDNERWNLVSRNHQDVVSGIYVYVVETNTEKLIGKMVIVR